MLQVIGESRKKIEISNCFKFDGKMSRSYLGLSEQPGPATAGDRVTPAATAPLNGRPWRHSWNVEHPALISLECLFHASVLVLTVYRNFISEFSYIGITFSFTRR